MSKLTKISLLLAIFFGLDKIVAIIRQVIIARQFGLSAELDAFNVANNIPDLLYAMISGGALAIALIPVLSETLSQDGRKSLWNLFSRIANISFIVTLGLAIGVAIMAPSLVYLKLDIPSGFAAFFSFIFGHDVNVVKTGIAPGFGEDQREVVVNLMRLNLIATLIFSISGLLMAGLQANQHFLFPAMSPILYNVGQIVGALFFAPRFGVYGLVYGVILGALLHLLIQIPALIKYDFKWIPSFGFQDFYVRKVLKLMGPRVLSIFTIQLIFLIRDSLASWLEEGSVSALSYGWMIQQLPETLIGTAIGTALLPTLSELVASNDEKEFKLTIERAVQVLFVITIPVAVIAGLGLGPFIGLVFDFSAQQTNLLLWVTRGYLVGLLGHSVLEIVARSFYARQNAIIPLIGSIINLTLYLVLGPVLCSRLGAAGVSLTDSIAFTTQAFILLFILSAQLKDKIDLGWVPLKGVAAGAAACVIMILIPWGLKSIAPLPEIVLTGLSMVLGTLACLPIVWKELRLVIRL